MKDFIAEFSKAWLGHFSSWLLQTEESSNLTDMILVYGLMGVGFWIGQNGDLSMLGWVILFLTVLNYLGWRFRERVKLLPGMN